MLENQGLSAIAFFEATAFLILLVLFVLLRKDHPTRFLAIWITGWSLITLKAVFELTRTSDEAPQLRLTRILLLVIVNFLFLSFEYINIFNFSFLPSFHHRMMKRIVFKLHVIRFRSFINIGVCCPNSVR